MANQFWGWLPGSVWKQSNRWADHPELVFESLLNSSMVISFFVLSGDTRYA